MPALTRSGEGLTGTKSLVSLHMPGGSSCPRLSNRGVRSASAFGLTLQVSSALLAPRRPGSDWVCPLGSPGLPAFQPQVLGCVVLHNDVSQFLTANLFLIYVCVRAFVCPCVYVCTVGSASLEDTKTHALKEVRVQRRQHQEGACVYSQLTGAAQHLGTCVLASGRPRFQPCVHSSAP